MINANGYTSKANAVRAARSNNLPEGEYAVDFFEGRWYVNTLPSAPAPRNRSEVGKPVQIVWGIVASMPGAKRSEQVVACVAAGVNKFTARTQVQLARQHYGAPVLAGV